MTEPGARVILDSVHPMGISRVLTLELTMHRFVLSEFNTHCGIAKNSESSRAVPLAKRIERVRTDPAIPVSWPREKPGMQGGEELQRGFRYDVEALWKSAVSFAASHASQMSDYQLHKSVANRVLEPFLWHVVIATATLDMWEHFFRLRCSKLAQPEIRVMAEAAERAVLASSPRTLGYDTWHLPLCDDVLDGPVFEEIADYAESLSKTTISILGLISAGRCARVSYDKHRADSDWRSDVKRARGLVDPGEGLPHASPFEHQVRPARRGDLWMPDDGSPMRNMPWVGGRHHGWHTLRHELKLG